MSRKNVRATLAEFIAPPAVEGLSQVFTSVPKTAFYETNSLPSDVSRCLAVIYIESERENRLAIGGAHSGIKRVDYQVAIQLHFRSTQRKGEDAMDDFDAVVDNLKDKLRSDHQFGDTTGYLVWQGAEPVIDASYGDPVMINAATVEIWATLRFDVTEMIQA